jgi:hypothetical protein
MPVIGAAKAVEVPRSPSPPAISIAIKPFRIALLRDSFNEFHREFVLLCSSDGIAVRTTNIDRSGSVWH